MKVKVIGRMYSEVPLFYAWDKEYKFPVYRELGAEEWTIDAESLKEARDWLAKNYPEYYMGCNIIGENSFTMTAVPCYEYGAGNYETVERCVNWVRKNREKL